MPTKKPGKTARKLRGVPKESSKDPRTEFLIRDNLMKFVSATLVRPQSVSLTDYRRWGAASQNSAH